MQTKCTKHPDAEQHQVNTTRNLGMAWQVCRAAPAAAEHAAAPDSGAAGGPLACMMRVPRLIDFDNKRAYFRARIRGERERYSGSLRIHVRREHVFEDSFHQLRAK